jgi:beta-galactosidase
MRRLFAAVSTFALVATVSICPALAQASAQQERVQPLTSPRSVTLLDDGWQFYPLPDFSAWPAQAQLSAEQIRQLKPPISGHGWRPVRLPDDYVVQGAISQEPNPSLLAQGSVCTMGGRECVPPGAEKVQGKAGELNRPGRTNYGGHGYLPVYPAWYQRDIKLSEADRNKSVWIDFGGIYRDAVVFVNGKFIAQHASGYTGFRLNITSDVRFGQPNTVSVFVDPRWFEGWWYEGGGIYRHVQLIVTNKLQVSPWGTFVDAQVPGEIHHGTSDGDHAAAKLSIKTTVRNDESAARRFVLVSQVVDPSGRVVASTSTEEKLASGEQSTFTQQAALADARLWSLEHRNLYSLITTIRAGNDVQDKKTTSFGVRTMRFDPDQGFFLNGKHVEIRGMCVHQDFPGVGVAAPDNLWPWRIKQLQAMGANGYRTAHHPVSDAFYDAADRMGMLVMAENRHLGDTYYPKASQDTTYSDLEDVKLMVLQQRNHPSIIMWSFCNEEGEGTKPHGAQIFQAMKQAVEKIDSTRPVTGGINGGYTADGYISVEDILGMNYHNAEFATIHHNFPKLMIYGSEDVNAKTSRGTLETSRPLGICSQYGCEHNLDAGPWRGWTIAVDNPYVAGEFVWTAYDYRGEPNPFSWPAVTSQTGVMDLAGFPKPIYYYWKNVWQQQPSVSITPDWTRSADQTGKDVLVRVFSNCDRVELMLNGKSVGALDVPKDRYVDWHVPYAPGTLTALGEKEGRVVARDSVSTAGAPAGLRLTAEVTSLKANSEDVAPIAVAVVDAAGKVVSTADNDIEFSVTGDGALAGVANGDPTSHELNVASQRKAFHGLAMILVRSSDHSGVIRIHARARGLNEGTITIPVMAGTSKLMTRK